MLAGACLPLVSIAVPLLAVRSLLRSAPASAAAAPQNAGTGIPDLARLDDWLSGLCAEQPVVVLVDDLQWADQATLDVLTFLIAGPAARRLAILATIRSDEVGDDHVLQRWLADIRRLPRVTEIGLGPLDHDATAAQISSLLGQVVHTALVDDVFARSGGNPYLSRLIVQGLAPTARRIDAELPRDLRTAVLGTWSRLASAAREATTALAVAGVPLAPAELAFALPVGESRVRGALQAAAGVGLVETRTDGTYWFVHPLSAEVLEGSLPAERRRSLHAAFAMFLETRGARGDLRTATAVADHWNRGGIPIAAYRSALRAADIAESSGAWLDALRMLERAASLWDRDRGDDVTAILRRRIGAARNAGALQAELGAIDALLGAPGEGSSGADAAEVSRLLLRRIHLRFMNGNAFFDLEETRRAVAAAPPGTTAHASALAELAHAGAWHGDPAAPENARRALDEARAHDDDATLSYALTANAMQAVLAEDGARGLELAEAGAEAALRARDWLALGHAALWEANACETWAAQSYASRVGVRSAQMREQGAPHAYIAWLAGNQAMSSLAAGDWEECAVRLREALASDPGPVGDVQARLTAARLAALQGRQREAEQHLARAEELFEVTSDFLAHPFDPIRAEVRLGGHDPGGAQDAAQRGIAAEGMPPTMCEWLLPLAARAIADRIGATRDAGGDTRSIQDELEAFVAAHPDIIRDFGNSTPLWESQIHALGALYASERARGLADADESERWIVAADALVTACLPWEQAYARRRAAEALLVRDGDRLRGADQLRRGLVLAQTLAAAPIESELRALARRARVALATPAPVDGDRLSAVAITPRERDILSLVVAGRTYGEIARELVISEKTVSTHISHLLGKTGTANRIELAGFAERALSAQDG
ncbi:hypothetical protein GCM10009739_31330 [Microbacterium ulmi]